jgi:hypothetical protein
MFIIAKIHLQGKENGAKRNAYRILVWESQKERVH